MINKLYSILVSGCFRIPEEFAMYRKYENISAHIDGIPYDNDPYIRSLWANYVIELAKLSHIYENVLELDKSNTYMTSPYGINMVVTTDGVSIVKLSDKYPVLDLDGVIQDNTLIYSANGQDNKMITVPEGRTIVINGFTLKLHDGSHDVKAHIENPAVALALPSRNVINRNIKLIKDVYNDADLDDPKDLSAIFCLYVLRKYNEPN